jgi:hypothetical protein
MYLYISSNECQTVEINMRVRSVTPDNKAEQWIRKGSKETLLFARLHDIFDTSRKTEK